MLVFLRIVMLLLPLVALLMWLRWRSRRGLAPEEVAIEYRRLKKGLIVVGVGFLATALMLRFFDPQTGDTNSVYIPAHEENGVLVPGRFVPKDQAPDKHTAPTENSGEAPEGDDR